MVGFRSTRTLLDESVRIDGDVASLLVKDDVTWCEAVHAFPVGLRTAVAGCERCPEDV